MPIQQQLIPELQEPTPPGAPVRVGPAPAPIWLQRLSLGVFVLFCFYIGGLLTLLPWSPGYWEQNGWLLAHPGLNHYLQMGWVRGTISGLGLLDIWIAISEWLHYRDYRG